MQSCDENRFGGLIPGFHGIVRLHKNANLTRRYNGKHLESPKKSLQMFAFQSLEN